MSLSKEARQLYDCLPEDGTAISGGNLKWETEFDTKTYKAAKAELKEAGLVTLGRGRGGSVARIAEVKVEEVAPPPPSKEELLAHAREVKETKTRQQRESEALREHVEDIGRRNFPDAKEIRAGRYANSWYVEVWNGKGASIWGVPDELLI